MISAVPHDGSRARIDPTTHKRASARITTQQAFAYLSRAMPFATQAYAVVKSQHNIAGVCIEPPMGTRPLQSAVMLVVYNDQGRFYLAATKRGLQMRTFPGQTVFPGGKLDYDGESLQDAAVREVKEEIGVTISPQEIVGQLPTVWRVTERGTYQIAPFVAVIAQEGRPMFTINRAEVEHIVSIDVTHWFRSDTHLETGTRLPFSFGSKFTYLALSEAVNLGKRAGVTTSSSATSHTA